MKKIKIFENSIENISIHRFLEDKYPCIDVLAKASSDQCVLMHIDITHDLYIGYFLYKNGDKFIPVIDIPAISHNAMDVATQLFGDKLHCDMSVYEISKKIDYKTFNGFKNVAANIVNAISSTGIILVYNDNNINRAEKCKKKKRHKVKNNKNTNQVSQLLESGLGDVLENMYNELNDYDANADRINKALAIAKKNGGVVGDHHKAWVIDQMVRALTGDGYELFIKEYNHPDDNGDAPVKWATGIAP